MAVSLLPGRSVGPGAGHLSDGPENDDTAEVADSSMGFVVTLLTLSHSLLPLVGTLVGLPWLAAVSVLMLLGRVESTISGRIRSVR